MIDPPSTLYTAAAPSGALRASMNVERLGRRLFAAVALVLLIPALLMLALLAIVLALGLGVPIFASPSREGSATRKRL